MVKSKIVIIDYNSGNLRSVFNAISSIKEENHEVLISNNPKDLESATHIILPGVGAFKDCKEGLSNVAGMIDEIKKQIKNKKPFLGICVGMQLLADIGLENGETKGLEIISGCVKKMSSDDGNLKVPHIGWNDLEINLDHKILSGIKQGDHVYFVHSYLFDIADENNVIAKVTYGSNKINAIIAQNNIIATQFHPEKSAKAGLQLLKNFITT
jgi:glutamine amidotransferase